MRASKEYVYEKAFFMCTDGENCVVRECFRDKFTISLPYTCLYFAVPLPVLYN